MKVSIEGEVEIMYSDLLEYGRVILNSRYNSVPFELLDKLSDSMELYQLKLSLAENGFRPGFVIEENSLNQAYELMENATNDVDFVLHTINYIALRNPFIKNELLDFLKGC